MYTSNVIVTLVVILGDIQPVCYIFVNCKCFENLQYKTVSL